MRDMTSPLSMPVTTASRSLWVVQALLGFVGALLLLLALGLQARTEQWITAVEQHILVEIPAPKPNQPETIDPGSVRDVVRNTHALADVRLLSRQAVADSLKGWIDNIDILPLPQLIRATAHDGFDANALRQKLRADYPGVIVHEGKTAMSQGLRQINALRWLSYSLVVIVIITGAAMSLAAALWRLDTQDEIIELLHGMGASRLYIVQHLARSSFLQTLTSAGAGFCLALLFSGLGWIISGDDNPARIQLLSIPGALAAAAVPIALALLSAATASHAVRLRYTPFRKLKS